MTQRSCSGIRGESQRLPSKLWGKPFGTAPGSAPAPLYLQQPVGCGDLTVVVTSHWWPLGWKLSSWRQLLHIGSELSLSSTHAEAPKGIPHVPRLWGSRGHLTSHHGAYPSPARYRAGNQWLLSQAAPETGQPSARAKEKGDEGGDVGSIHQAAQDLHVALHQVVAAWVCSPAR